MDKVSFMITNGDNIDHIELINNSINDNNIMNGLYNVQNGNIEGKDYPQDIIDIHAYPYPHPQPHPVVPINLVNLTTGYLRTNVSKSKDITPDNIISKIVQFINNLNDKFQSQQQQQKDGNPDNLCIDINSFLDETISSFVKDSPTEVLELLSSPDIFIHPEDEKNENNSSNTSPFKIFTFDQAIITENCYISSFDNMYTSPSYDQLLQQQSQNANTNTNSNGPENPNGNGNGNGNDCDDYKRAGNDHRNTNMNVNGFSFGPNINAPNPSFPGVVEYTPPPQFCFDNNQYPNRCDNYDGYNDGYNYSHGDYGYEYPSNQNGYNQTQSPAPFPYHGYGESGDARNQMQRPWQMQPRMHGYNQHQHPSPSPMPPPRGGFIPHQHQHQGPSNSDRERAGSRSPNFSQMPIDVIMKMEISVREMAEHNLIERFMKDRFGSEYLQDLVRLESKRGRNKCKQYEVDKENMKIIIDYLQRDYVNVGLLAFHPYGNYILSILFEFATIQQQSILFQEIITKNVHNLKSNQSQKENKNQNSNQQTKRQKENEKDKFLIKLALSLSGCRVIQNVLDALNKGNERENKELLLQFVKWLERDIKKAGKMNAMLTNCNANHVIQKIVNLRLPHQQIKFIVDALNRDLVYYSEDKHACRVVQAVIDLYGDKLDIDQLLVNDAHLRLSCLPFANYVVQCIIKCDEWYSKYNAFIKFKDKFINALFKNKDDISYLCFNKFGSNVMEKCIMAANKHQLDDLINSLCWNRCSGLNDMIPNEFANYVLSKLYIHCDQKQKESIANCVHNQIVDLYDPYLVEKYKFGWEFLLKCHDIKSKMDINWNKNRSTTTKKVYNNNKKNNYKQSNRRYYHNKRYYYR